MLKRKIEKEIQDFFVNNPKKALMITGARQVGKSYTIKEYIKKNYKHYVIIDFLDNPEYIELIGASKGADEILLRLSAIFGLEMVENETIFFFDEVQECINLITAIKYLIEDGRFRYILSGSLLGTIMNDVRSMPVGYLTIKEMYPLDFKEFMIASGVSEEVIQLLNNSFDKKTLVDNFINKKVLSLFELFLIVGGMPKAVDTYLETKNLKRVEEEQKYIIELYKKDISKYNKHEKLYLEDIFSLIPSELNSKNKRFILKNLNEGAKYSRYSNSFMWLKDAGVALPCFTVNEPTVPLLLSKSSNLFKLYLSDVGLLSQMYGSNIQLDILKHKVDINFGSIYENVVAEELNSHGFDLYFYNSKKHGEVDFLVEKNNKIIPIEVKSGKDYYTHSALNNIRNIYGIGDSYVFCNGNVEEKDGITYYPIYMITFLLKENEKTDLIYTVDLEGLT